MDEPAAMEVARPEAEIVATVVVDEVQVTELVRFCALASEYVPVAVNCCVAPWTIAGLEGVTAIDASVAAETLRTVEPITEPDVA